MVERFVRDEEAAGSNPVTPIKRKFIQNQMFWLPVTTAKHPQPKARNVYGIRFAAWEGFACGTTHLEPDTEVPQTATLEQHRSGFRRVRWTTDLVRPLRHTGKPKEVRSGDRPNGWKMAEITPLKAMPTPRLSKSASRTGSTWSTTTVSPTASPPIGCIWCGRQSGDFANCMATVGLLGSAPRLSRLCGPPGSKTG